MFVRLVAVSFDAHDPDGLAVFWAGMLDRDIVREASGETAYLTRHRDQLQ